MKQSTTPATEQILHTQGEWKTEYCLDGGVFINAGERCIACIQTEEDNPPTKEDEANAELIVKAVNERQALIDENEKVKRLLHDLTPGGSEFYNDPEYCAKWIRENREENHYSLSNLIKKLKEERQALLKKNNDLGVNLEACKAANKVNLQTLNNVAKELSQLKEERQALLDSHRELLENLERVLDRIGENGYQHDFPSAYERATKALTNAKKLNQ